MRISTKLKVGYMFSAFIVIFAGIIIYTSFKQMQSSSRELKFVDTITAGLFELNIAGNEFLLYQEKRPKIQWEIKYKALIRLLEKDNLLSPNRQSLLVKMREDLALVGAFFSDLVSRSCRTILGLVLLP